MAKTFSDLSPEKRKQIHDAALQYLQKMATNELTHKKLPTKLVFPKGYCFTISKTNKAFAFIC